LAEAIAPNPTVENLRVFGPDSGAELCKTREARISIGALGCYGRSRMPKGPVELRVGGQTYRVVATAEEADLHRLADVVDERLRKLTAPGRSVSPQSLLLAAMSLAHELEDERNRRVRSEQRSREMLSSLVARIDAALEADSAELAAAPPTKEPGADLDGDEVEFDFGPGLDP
jgi:cell division protein ZapA